MKRRTSKNDACVMYIRYCYCYALLNFFVFQCTASRGAGMGVGMGMVHGMHFMALD